MTQISARKIDLTFLTVCSAFPILPVATAAAQTLPQTQQKVENPNVPELIAPLEDDLEPVFSPPRPSQPDKLITSDQLELFTSIETTEDNQTKEDSPQSLISSNQIDLFTSGEKAENKQMEEKGKAPISSEIRIITPIPGVTTAKTTNLGVQYHPTNQVTVTLNGKPIDAAISHYLHQDEAQQLNTLIWYNLPLNIGENTITAQGADGKSTSVKVTVEEVQKKIAIAPTQEPRIPADGRSSITLQGKITDEKGEIITEDVAVTLTASAGNFVGADQDTDAPGFQVLARKGEFTATLQAGLIAQNVKIRAAIDKAPELEAYTNVEFITNLRPSLATGSINVRIGAGGTDYWGSFRDYLNPNKIGHTSVDVDAAVFATGKVGDWLFTGAFNSQRPLNQDCNGDNRLFGGIQSCEKEYPVYGDSSSFTTTAPSIDSVYARFERTPETPGAEPDYFMWGDYSSEEFARTSQLYTATTRQLHGFKGNYNFGNLQLTALYANNIQGFQRDTITPNGTSGYYFLSRRLVVPGSENVFIEAEEINRPGTVLERQSLSRGSDYEIDYQRGTLLFRRPILATQLNPFGKNLVRRIVVTYQNDAGEDSNLYAGRLQYNLRTSDTVNSQNGHPFIGASYLREDQGQQDFELYGIDFFAPLGNSGQIIGEYAHSRHNTLTFGSVSGSAYRLEAIGNLGKNFQGQAYYRSVTENFANNATWSFTPGQTRYGASLTGKLGQTTSFNLGYDREDNFGIAPAERTQLVDLFNPQPQPAPGSKVNNSLTTLRAGIQQKIGESDLSVEYVNHSREDRINNQFNGNASQLVSRLDVPVTESLTFHAQNELNLGKSDQLYPNRTTFGLDWALYPGVSMRLAHQFFDGGLLQGNSITSLDTIVEHKFSPDTTIRGRYSILGNADGMTDQGSVSVNHGIRLAPGLKLSLGYEHIFKDIFGDTATGIRFAQPYAVGQSASSLGLFAGDVYSIGLDYTDNPNFQANARLEHRNGSEGNHTVISAAASGKLSPAITAAVRYQQAGGANQLLQGLGDTANLRVGLAYRDPNDDKFNALLGYEYRQNPATTPDTLLAGIGNGSVDHLFSAEAIYAPNWQWEFYGKYAFRNSSNSLAENFTNHSSIHLAQLRATYQLGYRTDVALEGRWLGQPDQGFNEFGVAVEGGYHLTPDLRIGLGYAFGSADDQDFSGYRSAGGPYININFKLNELFGGFGRQKVVPPQQQESVVQPVALGSK